MQTQQHGNTMKSNHELIKRITNRENLNRAFQKVKRNKGAAGVDAKDIEATRLYLKEYGQEIIGLIQDGMYKPKAVRRVEIPKPNGGETNAGYPHSNRPSHPTSIKAPYYTSRVVRRFCIGLLGGASINKGLYK